MFHLADNLSLPAEAVTQTFSLLARRGAGKTHTAAVLAEEMLKAGHPIVWLDPIGVAWGLRSHFGVAILGGEHADAPLEPASGKVVADFIVSQRLPVILDLSGFGENEMRRFAGEFAQRFYEKNRDPIHLFVDEADEFAPQDSSGKGPTAVCLGAMQNIVRRGRARGIGVTLITQRSAVLNKSVLTQTECLIAMQTTAPHDLKAIAEWIKYHGTPEECATILATLPKLQQGEAWVYSPGWLKILKRVKFRARTSFDSSRTPKPGERKAAPKSLADVDLAALTKEMQATIERAKADDPKELRRQISDLKKQLAANRPADADEKTIERAVTMAKRVVEAEYQKALGERDKTIRDLTARMGKAATLLHLNGESPPIRQLTISAPKAPAVDSPKPVKAAPLPVSRVPGAEGELSLGKAERAILGAFYWLQNEEATPAKVGFYADYTANSGSFNNACGRLRSAGLLSGWRITDAGASMAESLGIGPKPSGAELREWLRRKLGKAENALLDALGEAYPERLTVEQLGAVSGYTSGSGSFNNALGRLRSIEAAEGYERDGGAKAADVFFE